MRVSCLHVHVVPVLPAHGFNTVFCKCFLVCFCFGFVVMAKKGVKVGKVASKVVSAAVKAAVGAKKRPASRNRITSGGQDVMSSGRSNRLDPRKNKMASGSEDLARYEAALTNPFSELAMGARVPDSYSFPSEVRHVKMVFTGTPRETGDMDVAVFAHPLYSLISGTGTWQGGIATPDSVANLTQRAVLSEAKLSAAFNNYRMVGGGIRIKFSNTYNTAQGRLFIAVQPSPTNLPVYSRIGASRTDIYEACDLPSEAITSGGVTSVALPTQILTYPYSLEIPTSELIGNTIEVPFRVSSAAFADWRESSSAAGASSGPSLVTTSGTGVDNTVPEGYCMSDGWSTVLIRGTGLSPSTSGLIDIEVIYHLEGTPAIGASASDPTILSGATTQPVVNVTGMFKALAKQSLSPFAKTARSALGASGNVGQAVTSRAMKVLGFSR